MQIYRYGENKKGAKALFGLSKKSISPPHQSPIGASFPLRGSQKPCDIKPSPRGAQSASGTRPALTEPRGETGVLRSKTRMRCL